VTANKHEHFSLIDLCPKLAASFHHSPDVPDAVPPRWVTGLNIRLDLELGIAWSAAVN
jgi:hypothetical protein